MIIRHRIRVKSGMTGERPDERPEAWPEEVF